MAAIVRTAADVRVAADVFNQLTLPAGEAIVAGDVVHPQAVSGKSVWLKATADTAPKSTNPYVALRNASAGIGVTAAKQTLIAVPESLAIDAPIYLSATTAGGWDTVAGTVPILIGRVVKIGLAQIFLPLT